ncbi:MAG: alpha/beta hydrolase [Acidobacteriota bacterium]|nr:alpha/beta hydrolase [Acidobacteriota bacterium]
MSLRLLVTILVLALFCDAAELPRKSGPVESYPGIEVKLGAIALADGTLLRTIVTYPAANSGKVPAVFFVGWLSCDSMESPSDSDGFAALMRRVVQRSGMLTFRVDKPGVGDSQGDCARTDFTRELAGYRAAFRALLAEPRVDRERVFLVGMSNGGGVAPLVAEETPVRAYVSVGGWSRTWLEHMLEHERVRLTLAAKPPGEVTRQLRGFATFYDEYLNQRKTPAQVLAGHPEMKAIWYDAPDGQYGRPAAFYQDLQSLDLAEAWARTPVPVLVIRGEYDWIMSRADASAIADAVNQTHPKAATYVELPVDHGLMKRGSMAEGFGRERSSFNEDVAVRVLDFLRTHSR